MNRVPNINSMNDLVAYQADSIVSKTLLKNDGGSVTLFAFAQGQELSEHTTPHAALLNVYDGAAEISIAGTPRTVSAGAIIELPANVPHAVKATSRFKMLLIMLKSSTPA